MPIMAERSGKQIFVRLPDELVVELDRFVEVLAEEQPGLNPSRSDAIRILLYRGLEVEKARRQRDGESNA
jgi:metal-responsive CopG/Arc/MetJ family transcriptional regulator